MEILRYKTAVIGVVDFLPLHKLHALPNGKLCVLYILFVICIVCVMSMCIYCMYVFVYDASCIVLSTSMLYLCCAEGIYVLCVSVCVYVVCTRIKDTLKSS